MESRFGMDYDTHFSIVDYQNLCYKIKGCPYEEIVRTRFKTWKDLFAKGGPDGQLLDLGCGPSIVQATLASRQYSDVTLADFAQINRQEITRWMRKDPQCLEWQEVFELTAEVEDQGASPSEIEERVRKAVRTILPCDLLQENPLHPATREAYDCILLSLVLDAACKDKQTYKSSLKNVVQLLKPGGRIIQDSMLGQTGYAVGEEWFFSLKIDMGMVREAYEEAGCDIVTCNQFGMNVDDEVSDGAGWFVLEAVKRG